MQILYWRLRTSRFRQNLEINLTPPLYRSGWATNTLLHHYYRSYDDYRPLDHPEPRNSRGISEEFIFLTWIDIWHSDSYSCPHANQSTDLVALRAGSAESGKNNFPLRFPPFSLISGISRCQKWILQIKINSPMCSKFFRGWKFLRKKLVWKLNL